MRIFILLLPVFFLFSCVSTSVSKVPISSPLAIADVKATGEVELKISAILFDKLIQGGISTKEKESLLKSCGVGWKTENPFCYTIQNYSLFEPSEEKKNHPSTKTTGRIIRPLTKGGRIQNWRELRFASVGELLRGLTRVPLTALFTLRESAIKEPLCPNNIAIALSATLEEHLPNNISATEISRLYEKGGDCLIELPIDRESLLTRAGLFLFIDKKYERAAALFEKASSISGTDSTRSLYWLYRTLRMSNKEENAKTVLLRLKTRSPFSFHTILALIYEKQDPDLIILGNEILSLKRSKDYDIANKLIAQVEILKRFGFESTAAKVLNWAIRESEGAEPEFKLYLAELKEEQNDHSSKIRLLSGLLSGNPSFISKKTMELFFPKAYFPIFEKNSSGIDPYLLLAIARQESAFNPAAISRANARGLLQVMPRIGRRFASSEKLSLHDPENNISVGAKYFVELLQGVNGQLHLALAAYNAGPSRVTQWAKRYPTEDPILFTDLIPFRETRNYVALILRNYYWYHRIDYPLSPKLPWTAGEMRAVSPGFQNDSSLGKEFP